MKKQMAQAIGNYLVYPDGYVISKTGWRGAEARRILPQKNQDGYLTVRMTVGGKRKKWLLHSLMAELFLEPKPGPGFQVCHNNGDKLDNRADNLRWGTAKENSEDREKHGNTSRGRRHSNKIRQAIERSKIEARLIAASPDLLRVAKLILEEWEKPTEGVQRGELIARLSQYVDIAREAVNKAEGKQ